MAFQPETRRGVEVDRVWQTRVREPWPRRAWRGTGAARDTKVVQVLLLQQQWQVIGDLAHERAVVVAGNGDPIAAWIQRRAAGVLIVLIGMDDEERVGGVD